MWNFIRFTFTITAVHALHINPFFNQWTCIGIPNKINWSKPYKINIGELPLVVWKTPKGKFASNINACHHMGSTLHEGTITPAGCLRCPYHGLEIEPTTFGQILEYDNKLFWAFEPNTKVPHGVPLYQNNPHYKKFYLEMDMDASLEDSAINSVDILHPKCVHYNEVFGFGSEIEPENIQHYWHSNAGVDRIAIAFNYYSTNKVLNAINQNHGEPSKNYHMFVYPSYMWSRVSFQQKDLVIALNLLPLTKNKTRWYVSVYYNYNLNMDLLKFMTQTIMGQDQVQMRKQIPESPLKSEILFNHKFPNELAVVKVNTLLKKYKYPSADDTLALYKQYKNNL